jgi:hypothetical protein
MYATEKSLVNAAHTSANAAQHCRNKAGDAGSPRRLGQLLGGNPTPLASGQLAQRYRSCQQVVSAQSERDEKCKTAKCRHRDRPSDCRTFRGSTTPRGNQGTL